MDSLRCLFLVSFIGFSFGYEDKSIVQWLVDAGNFSTLVTAVQTAGLADTLTNQGPFTVFAPTDIAFNKLGAVTINSLLNNPTQLAVILQHHVVPSYIFTDSVVVSETVTPLDGQDLNILRNNQELVINNVSTISLTVRDRVVNNGIIHEIDTVLLPPGSSTSTPALSIMQYLLTDDSKFLDLSLALLLSDLTSVLEAGDYTLFAPIDSAFALYQSNLLDPSQANAQLIYQAILKYHVIPGGRTAGQLTNGQTLYTLHGLPVNITVDSSGVLINNRGRVIEADILCSNGVIHAIDDIMVPSDINQVSQG